MFDLDYEELIHFFHFVYYKINTFWFDLDYEELILELTTFLYVRPSSFDLDYEELIRYWRW